jgi:hypothetical protein
MLSTCFKNNFIKKIKATSYSPEIFSYCSKLFQIVNKAEWNLWSPGTFNEIKYALNIRKEVYCLTNKTLKNVSIINNLPDEEAVIPFDEHHLFLYNKIWQPLVREVYENITTQL